MKIEKEPTITINGFTLNEAQAMTVRVAIEHFAVDLESDGLGDDDVGKRITDGYLKSIESIREIIFLRLISKKMIGCVGAKIEMCLACGWDGVDLVTWADPDHENDGGICRHDRMNTCQNKKK